jgi:hypothetical protein
MQHNWHYWRGKSRVRKNLLLNSSAYFLALKMEAVPIISEDSTIYRTE